MERPRPACLHQGRSTTRSQLPPSRSIGHVSSFLVLLLSPQLWTIRFGLFVNSTNARLFPSQVRCSHGTAENLVGSETAIRPADRLQESQRGSPFPPTRRMYRNALVGVAQPEFLHHCRREISPFCRLNQPLKSTPCMVGLLLSKE